MRHRSRRPAAKLILDRAEAEESRLQRSREAAERAEEAINGRAQTEQLGALNAKAEALREREKELTARDEARRLHDAAARAKAERKSG